MKKAHRIFVALLLIVPMTAYSQVNSGSDGSDGALNPTSNLTINMADHPTGIYQYSSVNIPSGVTVTFTPNSNNAPVVWLVQGNCVISGTVSVSSSNAGGSSPVGRPGGPGGYGGGTGGANPTPGLGPGGGSPGQNAGNASFATQGATNTGAAFSPQQPAGQTYGSSYCLPLTGGSGGGGSSFDSGYGGGGGGGAILIAASSSIQITGSVLANGNNSASYNRNAGGAGSGGAIRLVSTAISGTGTLSAAGGGDVFVGNSAGNGWVRIDAYNNSFAGSISGSFSQGFQPIIIPASGQGIQLAITSIGGVLVSSTPTGVLTNPDVVIPAQLTNPLSIVVTCTNIPLGTPISVTANSAIGGNVTAAGNNSTGTQASSTATILLNLPRGGGTIIASAETGVTTGSSATGAGFNDKVPKIAYTGWTAGGEEFTRVRISAAIGGKPHVAYVTKSGIRLSMPTN